MENAVLIRPEDSVVTVTQAVAKGGEVRYPGCTRETIAVQDIAIYHKVAIKELAKGDDVIKYGERIGIATANIHAGEHVHTHNIASLRA